jgi:hypothetical protein
MLCCMAATFITVSHLRTFHTWEASVHIVSARNTSEVSICRQQVVSCHPRSTAVVHACWLRTLQSLPLSSVFDDGQGIYHTPPQPPQFFIPLPPLPQLLSHRLTAQSPTVLRIAPRHQRLRLPTPILLSSSSGWWDQGGGVLRCIPGLEQGHTCLPEVMSSAATAAHSCDTT